MAQIEVEVRGRLLNFEKTLDFFKKKAKFAKEKDRLTLVYFRHELDKDINSKEVREDLVDLRLRITNKRAEIVLKHGKWGSEEQRREISIPIDSEKFSEAVDFLKYLDWNKGVITATKTFVFDYKGIEFALVKSSSYNYFEAEILTDNKQESEEAKKKILEAIKELGLKPMAEKEFISNISKMNNTKGMQFDFRKRDFSEIKERFKEFF